MSRKQNHNTYTIQASKTIEGKIVDIPEDVNLFYYANGDWGFTVQKQARRHSFYWNAKKRIKGKLHTVYLCNAWGIIDTLLWNTAQEFKSITASKMTPKEFRAFDEKEFETGDWVVTDPELVAEFDAWEKEQGFDNAA